MPNDIQLIMIKDTDLCSEVAKDICQFVSGGTIQSDYSLSKIIDTDVNYFEGGPPVGQK